MKVRSTFFLLLLFFILTGRLWAESAPIQFMPTDRLLVIAPHPDDETLGAGGLIQQALQSHAGVKILYLTHGDYNEIASIFYQKKPLILKEDFIKSGQIRKREAVNAMAVLGLDEKNLIFFGYPDFGTLNIWRKHWGDTKAFRSFLTQINKVPYKEDFSYGSEYRGDNIVRDLENVLRSYKPTYVLVTAPFDLNPDHQAAYLYLRVACLNVWGKGIRPKVYAYLVHARGWPAPKKYFPTAPLMPPTFLSSNQDVEMIHQSLTKNQIERKKQALQKYESQIAYSKNFLFSFVRSSEFYLSVSEDLLREPSSRAVGFRIEGHELSVDIRLENPLDVVSDLEVMIFGYDESISFVAMPKLSMRLFRDHLSVRDGPQRLHDSNIRTHVKKRRVTINVPLRLLKNPDYVFVSVQSAIEQRPVDFNAWRLLNIRPQKER